MTGAFRRHNPGLWGMLKEERALRDSQKFERERAVLRAVRVNLDDPDFRFHHLCERFAASDPKVILHVLRRHGVSVGSGGVMTITEQIVSGLDVLIKPD